jgi:flagellar hook-associated protein FlgK
VGLVLDPRSKQARPVSGVSGGELGGLLAFREEVLLPAQTRLSDLAKVFADSVNRVQHTGIDLRGEPGQDLFAYDAGAGVAATLSLALTDAQQIAAGGPLRVIADALNVAEGEVAVGFEAGPSPKPAILTDVFDPAGGQPTSDRRYELDAFKGLLTLPAGLRDVAIALDTEAGQWPQLFTRDGRHLLGGALTEAQQLQIMASESMMTGATYSADYLNAETEAAAYLGRAYFIGAKATATNSPIYDITGETHQILGLQSEPARLQGGGLDDVDSAIEIAEGALVLNGHDLGAFSGEPTADNLAQWLNEQIATLEISGVTAVVVEQGQQTLDDGAEGVGKKSLALVADDSEVEIRLGFGVGGSPTDMAYLGFRTSLYWDGEVPEDLVVLVTSTIEGTSEVALGATFSGEAVDSLESLREHTFDIDFVTASSYRITDVSTGTVVAERSLDAQNGGIAYRGALISFSTPPVAGDRYRLDANRDGYGDNSNLLALAELEYQKLENGYTIPESYVELSSRIGNVAQQASISNEALAVVYDQAVLARDQVSGVSLDVEAANLIKFQQAYQASAKVMQVATDLFNQILAIR